jgi:hypothetical protein
VGVRARARLILQIDATLEGAALHVRVRVRNPRDRETGMYWWTNIAVAQTAQSRVFALATHAYMTGYDGTLGRVDLNATDPRFPATAPAAADYFFDLAPGSTAEAAALRRPGSPPSTATDPASRTSRPRPDRPQALRLGRHPGRAALVRLARRRDRRLLRDPGRARHHAVRAPAHAPGATWEWTETFLPLRLSDPRSTAAGTSPSPRSGRRCCARRTPGSAGVARLEAAADIAPTRRPDRPGARSSRSSPRAAVPRSPSGARFVRDGEEGAYWAAGGPLLARRPTDRGHGSTSEPDPLEAPASTSPATSGITCSPRRPPPG